MSTAQTVRAYRRQFGLTQAELADLLGVSQTAVSRLEGDGEPATLETAFGLQVVFGIQPRLFAPGLYVTVEDAVMKRAAELDRELRGRSDPGSLKKLDLLASMAKRTRLTAPRT